MFDLELDRLTRRFGDVVAVDHLSLQVRQGELLSFLGPSGCGKTTVLRLITGFLRPDEGKVHIRGRVMNPVPPHRRDIAMVYQNYALFPHLTVWENVAFGLRMRHLPAAEMTTRVRQALELVHLPGLEDRYPGQLSGGQQQRAALARAIVVRPAVLLLDEPLSNLDAKLRVQVRAEIRELQQQLGMTTIFVTHDQEEALSLSDRVAVMHGGRVEQLGTPQQIYERPASDFVMRFVGSVNLWPGRVIARQGLHTIVAVGGGLRVAVQADALPRGAEAGAGAVLVGIRPEKIVLSDRPAQSGAGGGVNSFPGTILAASYLGSVSHYRVRVGEQVVVTVQRQNEDPARGNTTLHPGQTVYISWDPACCVLLGEARGGETGTDGPQ